MTFYNGLLILLYLKIEVSPNDMHDNGSKNIFTFIVYEKYWSIKTLIFIFVII